jgi:hypothetical protein
VLSDWRFLWRHQFEVALPQVLHQSMWRVDAQNNGIEFLRIQIVCLMSVYFVIRASFAKGFTSCFKHKISK